MSAYKKIECSLVDKDTLIKALAELGLTPATGQATLHGYRNDVREKNIDIVIPKEQLNKLFTRASNDLGFNWDDKTDQYVMTISDYDMAKGIHNRIKQAYAKVAIEQALSENRFQVIERSDTSQLQKKVKKKVQIIARKFI